MMGTCSSGKATPSSQSSGLDRGGADAEAGSPRATLPFGFPCCFTKRKEGGENGAASEFLPHTVQTRGVYRIVVLVLAGPGASTFT